MYGIFPLVNGFGILFLFFLNVVGEEGNSGFLWKKDASYEHEQYQSSLSMKGLEDPF